MNRFAQAYEHALLPLRRRDAGSGDAGPDPIDIAVGAGWYRLVCAVETLIDRLSALARRAAERPRAGSRAQPIGCG